MNVSRIYGMMFGCLIASYTSQTFANNAISVGYGPGTVGVHAYRFNLQRAWANDGCTFNHRRLTGYWELAFTNMHTATQYAVPVNHTVNAYSASIVLRIPFKLQFNWYADIGLGAAYLTHSTIAKRKLGSNWLFEDRLGAGVLLGERKQFEVGYRFVHYSNAYLAQCNQGMNLQLLILGYWFN